MHYCSCYADNSIYINSSLKNIFYLPVGLVGAIKETVIKHWYLGLQKTRDYHGTVELKLGGCPWWADSNDAVESRYFVSTLIGLLKVNGWQVCGTMDLTR